jgi:hypothetical protein
MFFYESVRYKNDGEYSANGESNSYINQRGDGEKWQVNLRVKRDIN